MMGHHPKARLSIIRSSLSFTGGMAGITIISIILSQTDKLVLSKALNLKDFGTYVIASTLASGLYMVISPVFSVMYPRLSQLANRGDERQLLETYHLAAQALSVMLLPMAAILVCFPKDVLFVWTGDATLSTAASMILALLVSGNIFNGVMNMPYALQLANGWVRLALWINVFGLTFFVPASWFAAKVFGPVGAAAVWLFLNLGYFFVWPPLLHQKLAVNEKKTWYLFDVLLPVVAAMSAAYILSIGRLMFGNMTRMELAIYLLLTWAIASFVAIALLPKIRQRILDGCSKFMKLDQLKCW